ncbi:MAG TPA: hypothetical protein VK356_10930, partial [Thermomicrobiales bacterium]|nr:hypothetical protein [Thermomicrobiales bacterium]
MKQLDGESWRTVALEVDRDSHIATLTLSRPQALNAISRELAGELFAACELLATRADVWSVIVAGAG